MYAKVSSRILTGVTIISLGFIILSLLLIQATAFASTLVRAEYPDFSIVVLPDTQMYCWYYPEIYANQTQWIVENVESRNILFVTHEGDIVEDYMKQSEWFVANASMSNLDGHVPWGIGPGNHDGDWTNPLMYGWLMFNKSFNYSRFSDQIWYGGAYNNTYTYRLENANNYEFFSGGEGDYLIFHLQYDPDDHVLAWANATVMSHPNRRVIVTTHDYLLPSGARSEIGERIWGGFVRHHVPQIFMVLCGHWSREARSTDNSIGYNVHQLMANYQGDVNGGNGALRILEFQPMESKIHVRTFLTFNNTFETDSDSEFTLDYVMTGEIPELTAFPVILLCLILIASITAIRMTNRRPRTGVLSCTNCGVSGSQIACP